MSEPALLLFLPIFAVAYNLDVGNSIIYGANSGHDEFDKSADNSYFGYSVLLYATSSQLINGSTVHESWIIIGAPKANYLQQPIYGKKVPVEPGVAYRCPLRGTCALVKVTNPYDEVGHVKMLNQNIIVVKDYGWFGASMSLDDAADLLTICAPRTVVNIYYSFDMKYDKDMHGVCYTGHLTHGDLRIEDTNFPNYDYSANFSYNAVNGFSVLYPPWKIKMQSNLRFPIIGSPKHEVWGSVHKMERQTYTQLPDGDSLTQLGYALTSGYYFSEHQLMVASSGPGWQYMGKVVIMDTGVTPFKIVKSVRGDEIGEFFGGSLATGDLNKDGLDDLIVGSPHWSNDNGRVQIFFGNKARPFDASMTLKGGVVDALYGYAVTSGDLDDDGYDDLIVGAPWEDSGVIYVYNGKANLQELTSIEPSQRIVGSSIYQDIRGFGFSLAELVDMDGNGFADLGVGAYASGHAVVSRSRPILKTELTVSLIPTALSQNATSFVLEVCVRNFIKNKPSMWAFECSATVDEDYKRIDYKKSSETILTWKRPPDGKACGNMTFVISNNSRNFIDPIDVVVTHRLLNSSCKSQGRRNQCELFPIEYKGDHSTISRKKLPFDIGCGEDNICNCSIFAGLFFGDTSSSTWNIGLNDLRLILVIGNSAEPAYLTTVTFYIPNGVTLRSILPSCQEDNDGESLMVTCDVGNPLGTATEKIVNLDLDMKRLRNGSSDGTKLDFRVDIKTLSSNRGVESVKAPLYLKANLSVALSGKAYDEKYYFDYNNEEVSNVTLQHNYQISRLGVTPIYEARLSIRVPYMIGDLKYLTLGNKPQISILGHFYECSVSNVPISASRLNADKAMDRRKSAEMIKLAGYANNTRNRRATRDNVPILGAETLMAQSIVPIDSPTSENTMHSDPDRSMPRFINPTEIHLNCSTPNVKCGQIVCNVAHLKTSQDVAKLQLNFIFDNSKFAKAAVHLNGTIIRFASEAWLEVVNPPMQFVVSGTGTVLPVTTTFHFAGKAKIVSFWIIAVSILLGLLALIVLAFVLKRIGFFERKHKEKLNLLKNSNAMPLES